MTNEEVLEAEARQLNRSCTLVDSAGFELGGDYVSIVAYEPEPADCPNGQKQHQQRLAVAVGDQVASSMVINTWFK